MQFPAFSLRKDGIDLGRCFLEARIGNVQELKQVCHRRTTTIFTSLDGEILHVLVGFINGTPSSIHCCADGVETFLT